MIKDSELIGRQFTRLTVVGLRRHRIAPRTRLYCMCLCACGKQKEIDYGNLKSGVVKSCGCLKSETSSFNAKRRNRAQTKNGLSRTKIYKIHRAMVERCTDPDHPAYPNYGGRGITVCDRWLHSLEAFREDMGDPPFEGASIDRIKNDLGYFKENCRWATRVQQARNKRGLRLIEIDGETKPLSQWVEERGVVSYAAIQSRLDRGWQPLPALTTPRLQEPNHGRRTAICVRG